jgi:hypothetical protein
MCVLAAAGVAVCAPGAFAQLVFGSTTPTTSNGAAFYLDVNTQQVTTLWNSAANKKVNGITGDPVTQHLYSNDAARLNVWNYGSVGTVPTFIAGLYRTNDNVTFTATGVDGLCWANGNLYGSTSFPSTTFQRGIYQISTTSDGMATPHCVMTPLWTEPTGTISFGDLDFNPADNKFYVTNTTDTTGTGGTLTRGLYSIDALGSGAMVKVANFPAGLTNVDGLTIGGGTFWMTQQEPANSRIDIYPWDPATQTYGTPIFVPLTDATQRASDAAWLPGAVPAPGVGTVLVMAGLALGRRRRAK